MSAARSPGAERRALPEFHDEGPGTSSGATGSGIGLNKTLSAMQNFMIRKGIIDSSMTEEEIQLCLENQLEQEDCSDGESEKDAEQRGPRPEPETFRNKTKSKQPKSVRQGKDIISQDSSSEVTIYKRAVQEIAPELEEQIDHFISVNRKTPVKRGGDYEKGRKASSSSEELMDTSDEVEMNLNNIRFFADPLPEPERMEVEEVDPEQRAREIVRDHEKSKATMYEITGKDYSNVKPSSIAEMDNNYQMIDAHLEESVRKKIENFEYVDLAKLLSKNKSSKEGEQRLEIVTKNGMTYLAPVSDKEGGINSYGKWEQAFRVYSNVLTSRYPHKAPELLQYNHTIHTAASSYTWENVYAYDREFRQHISRFPSRAWNVLLQQAWTMLLKDRVKNENTVFQKGGYPPKNKRHKEPCRRYNKGRCSFGLSCNYDHRCSVPECGKFGHGAHICRLRKDKQSGNKQQQDSSRDSQGSHAK